MYLLDMLDRMNYVYLSQQVYKYSAVKHTVKFCVLMNYQLKIKGETSTFPSVDIISTDSTSVDSLLYNTNNEVHFEIMTSVTMQVV